MLEKVTAFLDSLSNLHKTKESALNSERRKILDKYLCHHNSTSYCQGNGTYVIGLDNRTHAIEDFLKHYDAILVDFAALDKKAIEI